MLKQKLSKKAIVSMILVVTALLSMFVFSKIATSPQVHKETIAYLDGKKDDVARVTLTSAAASLAVAAIPGDVTTPIANQIAELSTYFVIVVCAIIFEKYLITVAGYVTFSIIIPISCGMLLVYVFRKKEILKALALKLILFGMVLFLMVPVSVQVCKIIDEAFNVEKTLDELEQQQKEIEHDKKELENSNILEKLLESLKIKVYDKAKMMFSHFIDLVAVFLITSCVIPICVLLFLLWLVKILFGFDIKLPQKEKLIYKIESDLNENAVQSENENMIVQ